MSSLRITTAPQTWSLMHRELHRRVLMLHMVMGGGATSLSGGLGEGVSDKSCPSQPGRGREEEDREGSVKWLSIAGERNNQQPVSIIENGISLPSLPP